MKITAIVTDIEGTITDIAFVKNELFPYAREHMAKFVTEHAEQQAVAEQLQAVAHELGCDITDHASIVQQLVAWIDADVKATPLKTLQGLIWKDAYQSGAIKGHLYDEVVARLQAWKEAGLSLYVYSSGSVAAQKLLFTHSVAGDITPLFSGYYDTLIGQKVETASYTAIATDMGLDAGEILFLSDHAGELQAAREAGWEVAQLVRPGTTADERFPPYADLNEVAHDKRLQP